MSFPSLADPERYIGTVTQVTASQVQVNLPHATARPERRGQSRGAVGDFVFVDCERFKLLGRILETRVPDGERLSVEPVLGSNADPHPIGRIQLLAAVDPNSNKLQRGLPIFPKIGDGVFLADPRHLAKLIRDSVSKPGELTLSLGRIDAADGVDVCIPPEKIFGRHCGIFGATGGGKSWTLASLVENLKKAGGKAILFDPTGEFTNLTAVDSVFVFSSAETGQTQVHFPYQHATEDDLFLLFRPSTQSQGPRLREAIKSLKLVEALGGTIPPGVLIKSGNLEKSGQRRQPFLDVVALHSEALHHPLCRFDITRLSIQLKNECISAFPPNGSPQNFGNPDNNSLSFCEQLISRIDMFVQSAQLECLFKAMGTSLVDELDSFVNDDHRDIAVISFRDVRFEHNTREILLNVIGRYLLGLARKGAFRSHPLVVFLDEAHQFLGRIIGDDYASGQLDSFGLIAKEGRKYGLTCTLATQRPRDIPQDVLSQLGTMFVHRLTNDQDRETIERACGDLDRGAAQFIPVLAPGEAVVIGPDLPAPLPLFMHPPRDRPDSKGPGFQAYWAERRKKPRPAPARPSPVSAKAAGASKPSTIGRDLDDEIPF